MLMLHNHCTCMGRTHPLRESAHQQCGKTYARRERAAATAAPKAYVRPSSSWHRRVRCTCRRRRCHWQLDACDEHAAALARGAARPGATSDTPARERAAATAAPRGVGAHPVAGMIGAGARAAVGAHSRERGERAQSAARAARSAAPTLTRHALRRRPDLAGLRAHS